LFSPFQVNAARYGAGSGISKPALCRNTSDSGFNANIGRPSSEPGATSC
jgi:hypothetical protein